MTTSQPHHHTRPSSFITIILSLLLLSHQTTLTLASSSNEFDPYTPSSGLLLALSGGNYSIMATSSLVTNTDTYQILSETSDAYTHTDADASNTDMADLQCQHYKHGCRITPIIAHHTGAERSSYATLMRKIDPLKQPDFYDMTPRPRSVSFLPAQVMKSKSKSKGGGRRRRNEVVLLGAVGSGNDCHFLTRFMCMTLHSLKYWSALNVPVPVPVSFTPSSDESESESEAGSEGGLFYDDTEPFTMHGSTPRISDISQLLTAFLYARRTFPFYAFTMLCGVERHECNELNADMNDEDEDKDAFIGVVYTYDAIGSKERVISGTQGVGAKAAQVYLDGVVDHDRSLRSKLQGVVDYSANNNNNSYDDRNEDLDPHPPGHPVTTSLSKSTTKASAVTAVLRCYKRVGARESGLGFGKSFNGGERKGGEVVVWIVDAKGVERRVYDV